MSTTVDERIVEMRFDNKNFERNVQTSMSTIDKLKQKLNFSGASKGFENLSASAKKVTLDGLGSGIETVKTKFSAMEIAGITALANITNSAVNAGKRMVKSLTIDPINQGFSEYELKMNSVQTIMASTGESLPTVNGYLEDLNKYADKTIYSFSDMTSNIGKFTNAGVKLDDAVKAIQGISNEAAVSGANANEASRAMYNFAQALSAGYVKLIDWKSIENANMATVEFKQQLIDTAVALGTVVKVGDKYQTTTTDLNGNVSELFDSTSMFNDSLSSQWMTTDVLTRTLSNYATDVRDMTDAEKKAYEAKLKSIGYTDEQIKKIEELGQKAFDSAQDVKTFSQLMDTLKEAVGSGWAQTWEILFGDFEQAKKLWTKVSDVVGGFIEKVSNARNNLLKKIMGSPIGQLADKVSKFSDSAKNATKSAKELGDIVNRVIRGDFGNGQKRWDALTEAGYNWAEVQNAVNEKLGYSKRHVVDLAEKQKKLSKETNQSIEDLLKLSDAQLENKGFTKSEIKALRELEEQSKKTGKPVGELIDTLTKSTGRELLGQVFTNLGKTISNVATAIKEAWFDIFEPIKSDVVAEKIYNVIEAIQSFTKKLKENDEMVDKIKRTFKGLFALLDIIRNITGGALKVALTVLCKLFGMVDLDVLGLTAKIGDLIVKFREWLLNNEIINKVIDKLVSGIKKAYGFISKWIKAFFELPAVQRFVENFKKACTFDNISKTIKTAYKTVKKFITAFLELPLVQKILEKFKSGASSAFEVGKKLVSNIVESIKDGTILEDMKNFGIKVIRGIVKGLSKAYEIGKYIVSGLIKGLLDGTIWKTIKEFANKIISTVCDILEIHSPSKVFEWIGENIIRGLVNGIKSMVSGLLGFVTDIINIFVEKFKSINIDWDKIFDIAKNVGAIVILYKTSDAIQKIGKGFAGFGSMLEGVGEVTRSFAKGLPKLMKSASKVLKSFSGTLKAFSFSIKAKALKDIAIAIMMLVGSIAALAFMVKFGGISQKDIWKAFGLFAVVAGVLTIMMLVMTKLSEVTKITSLIKGDIKQTSQMGKIALAIMSMASALLVAAIAMRVIAGLDEKEFNRACIGFGLILTGIAGLLTVYGLIVKGKAAQNIDKVGGTILKLSVAMLLLVRIAKSMADFVENTPPEILAGAALSLVALSAIIAILVAVTNLAGKKIDKAGGTIIKIAIAMGLLLLVTKAISKFVETATPELLAKTAAALFGLVKIIAILMVSTRLVGEFVDKAGNTILKFSVAILALTLAAKILSTMDLADMGRAAVGLIGLLGVITVLVLITNLIPKLADGQTMADVSKTLLAMAGAIAIIAAVTVVLGLIPTDILERGIKIVFFLSAFVAGLVAVTKYATDCKGTMLGIAAAIGVLAIAIGILSFIDPEKLIAPTIALGALMLIFALLIKVGNEAQTSLKSVGAIGLMIGVIVSLTVLLAVTQKLQPEQSIATAISLSILLLALTASLKILSSSKGLYDSAFNEALMMIGIIAALGLLLKVVSGMQIENVLVTAISLSVFVLALTAALKILASSNSIDIAQVLIQVIAMIGIIAALSILLEAVSGMQIENILVTVISLSAFLIALSVALNMMNGTIAGSAALLVASVALIALSQALIMLSSIGMESMATGLIGLAVGLGLLCVAGAISMAIWPGLLALAAAIVLVGVGALAAGEGVKLFAQGMSLLNNVQWGTVVPGMLGLAVSFLAITATSATLAIATPLIMIFSVALLALGVASPIAGLGMIILSTALSSVASIPIAEISANIFMLAGAVALFAAASLGAVIAAPLMILLSAGLTALGAGCTIAGAGMLLVAVALGALSSAFSSEAGPLSGAAANLFKSITGSISKVLSSAINNVKSIAKKIMDGGFIRGIVSRASSAIKTVASIPTKCIEKLRESTNGFKSAAKYLVDGFTNGIKNKVSGAVDAVKNLGKKCVDGIKKFLRINSPSKLMEEIGEFTGEGFIEGISSKASEATSSSKDFGSDVVSSFNDGINSEDVDLSNLTDSFGDLDSIDLSNITDADFSNISDLKDLDFSNVTNLENVDLSNLDLEGSGLETEKPFNPLGDVSETDKEAAAIMEKEAAIRAYNEALKALNGSSGDSGKSAAETLKDIQKVVDDVWAGKYGSGEKRVKSLIEAGYDADKIQDLVNKGRGYQVKAEDISGLITKNAKALKEYKAAWQQIRDLGITDAEMNRYLNTGSIIDPNDVEVSLEDWKSVYEKYLDGVRITDPVAYILAKQSISNADRKKLQGKHTEELDEFLAEEKKMLVYYFRKQVGNWTKDPELAKAWSDNIGDVYANGGNVYDEILKIFYTAFPDKAPKIDETKLGFTKIADDTKKRLEEMTDETDKLRNKYLDFLISTGKTAKIGSEVGIALANTIISIKDGNAKKIEKAIEEQERLVESYEENYNKSAKRTFLDNLSDSLESYEAFLFSGVTSDHEIAKKNGEESANTFYASFSGNLTSCLAGFDFKIEIDENDQPVIRPVVDLSDVQTGVSKVQSMFGAFNLDGMSSKIGNISSMMNRQNGGKNDVVSAINSLRTDIKNIKTNTYNVNGITYDDGSNVSSAIKTLVRAAKIERRV